MDTVLFEIKNACVKNQRHISITNQALKIKYLLVIGSFYNHFDCFKFTLLMSFYDLLLSPGLLFKNNVDYPKIICMITYEHFVTKKPKLYLLMTC